MSLLAASEHPVALAFDDVLLVPQYSEVVPAAVDIATSLTPEIALRIPFISAAMDTVTEAGMAMAIARQGGLGIVHKNLTIEAQAREVQRVKKSESGMILDPIVTCPDATVADVLALMRHHEISGIPVVEAGRLVGIVTRRDLRFVSRTQQRVREIMTSQVVTAVEGTTLETGKTLLQEHRIEKLPVVDAQGRLKGLITIKDIEKSERYPGATKDRFGRLCVGAAIGVGSDRAERVTALREAATDVLVVDSAHGHSRGVLDAVRATREQWPDAVIVAGNVVTGEGTKALAEAGANAVKVGIGPGSICTTRVVAGVGMPQFSAIRECATAAKTAGVTIVADGGIRHSGDIVKALAAGADCVMIGSLFAGTDEAPGEVVLYQGRAYKSYRGMGSLRAMQAGSAERYFQDAGEEPSKLVPEGVEGLVPHKGPVAAMTTQLTGGLRSGMGYVGAKDLPSLREHARFVQVTDAGNRESHVHDVTVTKEAPNYRVES